MPLPQDERRPLERLALVIWTAALCGCGLAIIAAICWFSIPPIAHDAAFIARFAVLDGFLYPHQPAKTAAFQACVVAAPFLIFGAMWIVRRIVAGLSVTGVRRAVQAGLALHLLFFAACMRPLFYYPNPPLWLPPGWLLCPMTFPPPVPGWEWMACAIFAIAFGFAAVAGPRERMRRWVIRVVAVLAFGLAPVVFYAPSQVNDNTEFTYHLDAMLDAMSQSINGHHLLVDFPHIYGGYGEILAPFLRLFPRTMAVPLLALGLTVFLSICFWLLAARRLIRNPAILALCASAILSVNFLAELPPNYCYITPRTLFPSLGLLLAISYLKRPTPLLFWIISTLAAVASVWNLDTGVVFWFAWTLTLLAGDVNHRSFRQAALHGLAQVALLAMAWIAFLVYLRLVSHQPLDMGFLFYFQSMVVKSGYFCVALVVPSAWTFVLLLYLTGLVLAVFAHLRPRVKWQGRMVLLLSLTAIGMFTYYMGRSAESNLISVSPPGILLAGLLGDRALARIRHGLMPPVTRWFFVPWAAMIFWWAFLFFVQLPMLLQRDFETCLDALPLHPTRVEMNAAFAARHTTPGESDVYFLSGNSGFYYYLTDTVRPLRIPGNIELVQMRDMGALLDAIRTRRIAKLFADRNFWAINMYRYDVYVAVSETITANYQPVALSPGGLLLYEPRPAP